MAQMMKSTVNKNLFEAENDTDQWALLAGGVFQLFETQEAAEEMESILIPNGIEASVFGSVWIIPPGYRPQATEIRLSEQEQGDLLARKAELETDLEQRIKAPPRSGLNHDDLMGFMGFFDDDPALITVKEAVEMTGVPLSERTVRYAARNGFIIGAQRKGRDWLFTKSAFYAWLDNRPKPGRSGMLEVSDFTDAQGKIEFKRGYVAYGRDIERFGEKEARQNLISQIKLHIKNMGVLKARRQVELVANAFFAAANQEHLGENE